jgi:hypothetical protein
VLGLVHLVVAGERARSSWAWGAGLAAGLAIWCKASGFMLTLPLLGVAVVLVRRRKKALAGLLVGPFLFLAAAWFALALARFGALWPPPPTGFLAEPATRLARAALGPRWGGGRIATSCTSSAPSPSPPEPG